MYFWLCVKYKKKKKEQRQKYVKKEWFSLVVAINLMSFVIYIISPEKFLQLCLS